MVNTHRLRVGIFVRTDFLYAFFFFWRYETINTNNKDLLINEEIKAAEVRVIGDSVVGGIVGNHNQAANMNYCTAKCTIITEGIAGGLVGCAADNSNTKGDHGVFSLSSMKFENGKVYSSIQVAQELKKNP